VIRRRTVLLRTFRAAEFERICQCATRHRRCPRFLWRPAIASTAAGTEGEVLSHRFLPRGFFFHGFAPPTEAVLFSLRRSFCYGEVGHLFARCKRVAQLHEPQPPLTSPSRTTVSFAADPPLLTGPVCDPCVPAVAFLGQHRRPRGVSCGKTTLGASLPMPPMKAHEKRPLSRAITGLRGRCARSARDALIFSSPSRRPPPPLTSGFLFQGNSPARRSSSA